MFADRADYNWIVPELSSVEDGSSGRRIQFIFELTDQSIQK